MPQPHHKPQDDQEGLVAVLAVSSMARGRTHVLGGGHVSVVMLVVTAADHRQRRRVSCPLLSQHVSHAAKAQPVH